MLTPEFLFYGTQKIIFYNHLFLPKPLVSRYVAGKERLKL